MKISIVANLIRTIRPDAPRDLQRYALMEWFCHGSTHHRKEPRPIVHYDVQDVFLRSYEWRRLRMMVIKKRGARCECCGTTPADGQTVINVDHIKPRKTNPELALVEENLQVLCNTCNHGKGNWDKTDWRRQNHQPPVPAAQETSDAIPDRLPVESFYQPTRIEFSHDRSAALEQQLLCELFASAPACGQCNQPARAATWDRGKLVWFCCDRRIAGIHIAPQWADRLGAGRRVES